MSRPLVILVAALLVIVAALFLLAGRATERPAAPVEKAVSLANLS